MKIFLFVLFTTISLTLSVKAQDAVSSKTPATKLDDLITRFDLFTDNEDSALKCIPALEAFSEQFKKEPTNPYAALYLGRAFDHLASVGTGCYYPTRLFFPYADSALMFYKLADKLRPSIREKKFQFTVHNMIGHLFGSRALWYLREGKFDEARKEMIEGMNQGGFTPAQIEVCRLMLDLCDSNAIFFPAGDDDTFPVMYLQMVEGYRSDVSVLNESLLSMSWYMKMFLGTPHPGFTPVIAQMTKIQIDSLDSADYRETVPDRIYSDIDIHTKNRLHKELGIDIPDKAELCFPVYEKYSKGYYSYGTHKAIAAILLANKWKRPVYFGNGGLESFLKCTHVAFRKDGLIDELLPIDFDKAEHFKVNGEWVDKDNLKKVIFHDMKFEKFSQDQKPSAAHLLLYHTLLLYLSSLDSKDAGVKRVCGIIKNIPLKYMEGNEEYIITLAQALYQKNMKSEARNEAMSVLPIFEKKISDPRLTLQRGDIDYIYALLFAGECAKVKNFINSFDISENTKSSLFQELKLNYDCK